MLINYKLADGKTIELEVTDEVGTFYLSSLKEEGKNDRRNTRRHTSLEEFTYEDARFFSDGIDHLADLIESEAISHAVSCLNERYPLSGMLFCSKCGATLKRRTWNSKHACRKIVWQCSNYIENGKGACTGTTIEDKVISSVDIQGPTVVKEIMKNGKKHYSYSSQSQPNQPCGKTTEKESGGIL